MITTVEPGVWGVLATPFSGAALEVDTIGIARLVEHAEQAGVTGLTVLGVFGEAARLSWQERRTVLETVLATTHLPLVVGCTSQATAPVIDEAEMAADLVGERLAAVMVQVNSVDPQALQNHLTAIHRDSGARIVIQDYPATTGVNVSSAVLGDVTVRCDFVAAVKAEAPPTPVAIAELTARCSVPVFGGLGGINLLDELAVGAAGAMTGFSYPEALVSCVREWFSGNAAASRAALIGYLPLIAFEQQPGIAMAIRKECLRRRGLISEAAVRPPARALPESLIDVLADHLSLAGVVTA
ncbi:dihydrodipicolinate synthase family protein [Nocardia colli]|uniref:Dihydrodipicolinate synthase family protein n=1 Tax=Nocardia colli TaxID=2545717 RepID=A0A5N0DV27_9NOCA|nr:dihydrodipicolinate synthase family protein [Nocardia colli]KAA8880603.1 dihydrodipicolinate synthase family protein [Nocardia colli]